MGVGSEVCLLKLKETQCFGDLQEEGDGISLGVLSDVLGIPVEQVQGLPSRTLLPACSPTQQRPEPAGPRG